ncbi:MAG: methyltransferase, partial [Acidimicrobiales bacterium]
MGDAMAALRDALGEIGYSHIYTLVAGSQLFAPDHARALRVARSAGGVEGAVLELLGLGATVPVARLGTSTSRALELCARAGLARVEDGLASTADWLVVPALGGYLLTGPPPTYATRRTVGASAYVGPDSLKLAGALPDPRGKRVLDIGTGCGIQGLLAARGASEAVCTDTEERSLALAACNRVLNATAHPVRLVRGDIYSPVAGERFDLVVSLPPYVPEVPAAAASRTVGGGPDGLSVLRPLLAGACEHLLPGGEVVVRSQLLCDARGPLLANELDLLAPGLVTTLTVTDWHPLQPYILELATSFATYGARATLRELVDQYSTSLRALGATGVCTALVR